MNFDINIVLAIIGTAFLAGSNIVWLISFYSAKAEAKAIEKRELGHIKNQQVQLSISLHNFFQDVDNKLDLIKDGVNEIKFECRIDKKEHQ